MRKILALIIALVLCGAAIAEGIERFFDSMES